MNADIQLQPLISAFIAHLSNERQLSPHTVDGYKRDLTALKKDLADQDIADWRDRKRTSPPHLYRRWEEAGAFGEDLTKTPFRDSNLL